MGSLVGCNNDEVIETQGTVSFSITSKDADERSRIEERAAKILVSVKNASGVLVADKKELSLYSFGDDFLSEPLALGNGTYTLTEFIVLNRDNEVIYLTPIADSPLAYLVDEPLPISFSVTKDETTKVSPEVIKAEGYASSDFGYTTFSFNKVNTFQIFIAAFIFDEASTSLKLTDYQLVVKTGVDTVFNGFFDSTTSSLVLSEKNSSYNFTFIKEGFIPTVKTYTRAELKEQFQNNTLQAVLLDNTLTIGLVAHYPFSGSANDAGSNGFNGTVNGATLTTDRHGVANSAYEFNGLNQYISVPHNSAFNFSGDFTISFWAKIDENQVDNSNNSGVHDLIRKWNGNAQGYPFAIAFQGSTFAGEPKNNLQFAMFDGNACDNVAEAFSPVSNFNEFMHIVYQRKGDKLIYYINNQKAGEFDDITTCDRTNTANVTFGVRGQLLRYFKGKMDDIRFYERALNDFEIANLYVE